MNRSPRMTIFAPIFLEEADRIPGVEKRLDEEVSKNEQRI